MFDMINININYKSFIFRTRGIYSSPPLACDPEAACAVHTMLGTRDLPLYLVAIKSFLRFYRAISIIVHSDGTLRPADMDTLRRHIPGCRLISPTEADEFGRRALGEQSFLYRVRGFDPCYRRLVDTELLGTTKKRIVLDSDVLVLNHPHEVIHWIEHGDRPFLIGQPPTTPPRTAAPDGPDNRHVQAIFEERLDQVSDKTGLPGSFLRGTTAGFYGCVGGLDLEKVERVIESGLQLGIPMRQWGGDQCVVIFLQSAAGADRLSPDRYLNFVPGFEEQAALANLIHFFGTYRFHKGIYAKLARRVILDLGQVALPAPV